jgi:hypothetical protein
LNFNKQINNQKLYEAVPESIVEAIKIPSQSFIAVAASGLNSKWYGCKVHYTAFNRDNIISEGTIIFNQPTIMGDIVSFENHVTTCHFGMDNLSKLVVKLNYGQLFSIVKSDLFTGDKNLIIVGDEIMQFTNATLQADNTYVLSGFLRELYGTKTDNFNRFALLDRNILQQIHLTNAVTKINLKVATFLDKKQLRVSDIVQEKSIIIDNNLLHPVRIIRDGNKISWTPRIITEGFFNDKVDHSFSVQLLDGDGNVLKKIYTMDYLYEIPDDLHNKVSEIMIAAFQDNRMKSDFISLKLEEIK